ncbi:hypothetical protein EGW08_019456 [Elysia chlorotica]|uniref:Uncharacterized protein n=1 Tax=Elysia chlorotica TaxID=188477 RepID=A0A3S1H5S9_ELYCH|nr:hypothetical protein EGW08_019456 [Elysia chlorotica]
MNYLACDAKAGSKPCKCEKKGDDYTATLEFKVKTALNNGDVQAIWVATKPAPAPVAPVPAEAAAGGADNATTPIEPAPMSAEKKNMVQTANVGVVKDKCEKSKTTGGAAETALVSFWLNFLCLAMANLVLN